MKTPISYNKLIISSKTGKYSIHKLQEKPEFKYCNNFKTCANPHNQVYKIQREKPNKPKGIKNSIEQ